ncbi:MAG: hypothetical protein V7K89_34330 [Nostoc sp.]
MFKPPRYSEPALREGFPPQATGVNDSEALASPRASALATQERHPKGGRRE